MSNQKGNEMKPREWRLRLCSLVINDRDDLDCYKDIVHVVELKPGAVMVTKHDLLKAFNRAAEHEQFACQELIDKMTAELFPDTTGDGV